MQNTSVGDIDYTVNASADGSLIASADGSLHIVDDRLAATLALVFDDQDSSYSNKNFGNENPIRPFTVTINGQPLTKEQYDALTFTVEGDGDVLPEVVLNEYREGEPTTGYVQFAPGTEIWRRSPENTHLRSARRATISVSPCQPRRRTGSR